MRWIQLILVFLITSLLVSAQNETGFNPDVPLADQIIEWQDEFELPEEGFIYPLTLGLTITDTEEDLILEITEEGITILNESTPIDMNINLTTDIISNISRINLWNFTLSSIDLLDKIKKRTNKIPAKKVLNVAAPERMP